MESSIFSRTAQDSTGQRRLHDVSRPTLRQHSGDLRQWTQGRYGTLRLYHVSFHYRPGQIRLRTYHSTSCSLRYSTNLPTSCSFRFHETWSEAAPSFVEASHFVHPLKLSSIQCFTIGISDSTGVRFDIQIRGIILHRGIPQYCPAPCSHTLSNCPNLYRHLESTNACLSSLGCCRTLAFLCSDPYPPVVTSQIMATNRKP